MSENNDKTIRTGTGNAPADQSDKTIRAGGAPSSAAEDKTIRSGSDKTIRTGGSDKTIRTSGDDKTIRTGGEDKTIRTGGPDISAAQGGSDDKTVRTGQATISSGEAGKPMSLQGTEEEEGYITLKGKKYKLIKTISEDTGEAKIYLVEQENAKFVLKLYYEDIQPNDGLLKKLRGLHHEDIITIYDFGYYQPTGYGFQRFYEIMEYAAGGTVEDILPIRNYTAIRQIVAETANALEFLHEKKIIHRDIKPGNLFYRDAEKTDVIIGDFGISSLMEEGIGLHGDTRDRSVLFSAPEMYLIGAHGQAFFDYRVDWYALGITVMVLWFGKQFGKGYSEDELMIEKNHGSITDPKYFNDIPIDERVLTLIKGLTVRELKNRWGLDQVKRWIKGEHVEVIEDSGSEASKQKPFNFDKEAGLIAWSREELGELLLRHPQLGIRYLYDGMIADWFKENEDPKSQMEIKEVIGKIFPKDQQAGLCTTAYMLNPTLPYIAPDGTECTNKKQLADAIEKNASYYKKALTKRSDPLYIFLASKGGHKFVNQYVNFMRDEKIGLDIALYHIIYSLDPGRPFLFKHPKDKKGKTVSYANNVLELEDLIDDYFDLGKEYFYNGTISAWLKFRKDTHELHAVAERMRKEFEQSAPEAGLMGLRWAMNKDLGYLGLQKDPVKLFTRKEIAAYLFKHFDAFSDKLKYKHDFLYVFMSAQNWKSIIDFIQYSYDAKKHKNKIGPYDNNVALMKSIRALDKDFVFVFDNGVEVSSPEDVLTKLGKIKKEIQKETEQPTSRFNAWISTFFHENPYGKFEEKGAYENKLRDYTEFLGKIKAKTNAVQRYHEARGSVQKVYNRSQKKDQSFLITRMGITIVFIMLTAYLTIKLFTVGVPIEESPMSGNAFSAPSLYYLIMAIIGVVLTFLGDDDFSFSTTLIGGPIIGLIGGVILYYIAYFVLGLLIAIIGIIAFALIVLVAGACGWLMWHNTYTNSALRKALYRDTSEWDLIWGPLQYAYSNKATYENSKLKEMANYASERKKSFRNLMFAGALGAIFLGGPAVLYSGAAGDIHKSALFETITSPTNDANFLQGEWTGKFEGRDMKMEFTSIENNIVKGNITVTYNKDVTQEFEGTYNPTKKVLTLKDLLDKKFKGSYKITPAEDGQKLIGTYILNSNKTKVEFDASKN